MCRVADGGGLAEKHDPGFCANYTKRLVVDFPARGRTTGHWLRQSPPLLKQRRGVKLSNLRA
jgi:hypothetical protein